MKRSTKSQKKKMKRGKAVGSSRPEDLRREMMQEPSASDKAVRAKFSMKKNGRWGFFLIFGCIFAIGAFLRLYTLSSQILLDDEWHSIMSVIGKSSLDVLTRFNAHDNTSPPFNLYSLILLRTVGVSELGLRLPMVLVGLLTLIVLPLLVERIFNKRVALLFALFLALSPFLIFYTRYARSYSWVALLCFSALLVSYFWLTTGKLKYGLGFVLLGAGAVYAHLLSIVAIVTPLAIGSFCRILHVYHQPRNLVRGRVHANGRLSESKGPAATGARTSLVSLKQVVLVALTLFVILLLLLWPAIRRTANLPWAKGSFTLESFLTAATLLSGTTTLALNILFFSLCIGGVVLLFKERSLVAWMFLLTIGGYIVLLLASRPLGIERGAVTLRYMIVAVPITLLSVSLALDRLIGRMQRGRYGQPWIGVAGTCAFLACLYAAGPLPALYSAPNNFTNHSAFQGSYRKQNWEHSKANSVYPDSSIGRDQVPSFYRELATRDDVQAIVEYPFDICDYNNLFYFYQHFHGKHVIAGHCRARELFGYSLLARSKGKIGARNADQILAAVSDPAKLRFRNMVDIGDAGALSHCGASLIVLHKYMDALEIMSDGFGTIRVHWRPVDYFQARFSEDVGPPVYEDQQLVCFRIKQAKD